MAISIEKTTMVNNEFSIKKYDWVGDFHEGLAWFMLNGEFGFINKEGKEVIEAKYDNVGDFHEGLARFATRVKSRVKYGNRIDYKYGIINTKGEEVVKAKYDWIGYFHKGLTIVGLNGKYGLIDKNGKEITDICFNNIFISDDKVIFNEEYVVPIDNLSLSYDCILKINGKKDAVKFDSMEKRDAFYNKINKKIEDEKQLINDLRSKMKEEILNKENKLYQDIDLEIKEEYTKLKKMG